MSGTDQIVINTRERAVSADINDLQSLKDRTLLDSWRQMLERRTFTLGAAPAGAPSNVVLGGLEVSPAGTDVVIAPGVLLQESLTLVPTPGTLDSSYRWASLLAAATETPPAPGSDTWYLLEAQMVEVVALSTTRDIFNTGTGLFVPTLVDKRNERTLAFQFITGTSTQAPAPTGGDWVPIAIVFRPGGGGPVLASHLIDVRPMFDRDLALDRFYSSSIRARGDRLVVTSSVPGTPSNSITVNAEVYANPQRLWHARTSALDVSAAAVLEVGTVLAADTWFYLYLCPWQGLAPVDPRVATATGRGVLCLSANGPATQGGARNTSTIALPAPYGVSAAPVNECVCVAALRRNAANTGWLVSWTVDGGKTFRIEGIQVHTAAALAAATPSSFDLATLPGIPATAKTAIVEINQAGGAVDDGAGGAAMPILVTLDPVGAGPAGFGTQKFDRRAGFAGCVFEVPVTGSTAFDLEWNWNAAPVAIADPDLEVVVVGWTE